MATPKELSAELSLTNLSIEIDENIRTLDEKLY